MSAYTLDDERTIRAGRRARDWMKSGLLSAEQYERIKPELQVDLRRTNIFLRITLFVFGVLILQSVMGLVAIFADLRNSIATAILCAVAAAFLFWLAGHLIARYRLYRFGVEEAAAVSAIILTGVGAGVGWSGPGRFNDFIAAGLAGAAAASTAVFLRFGYRYAAIAAIAFVTALPFQFGHDEAVHRLGAIAVLAVIAVVTRLKHREHGDEHPGDTYALLEAGAWAGIYILMNVQIFGRIDRTSAVFYWASYGGIWILPVLGLWLSIRGRHRMLLDVSVLMLLATLMSNKEYTGSPRYPWDPIVFGLLLMGGAIAIKRWLAGGENGARDGFTAARIVASDKATVGFFGTVASLAHPGTPEARPVPPDDPIGGGGRSGGAGAAGSF